MNGKSGDPFVKFTGCGNPAAYLPCSAEAVAATVHVSCFNYPLIDFCLFFISVRVEMARFCFYFIAIGEIKGGCYVQHICYRRWGRQRGFTCF